VGGSAVDWPPPLGQPPVRYLVRVCFRCDGVRQIRHAAGVAGSRSPGEAGDPPGRSSPRRMGSLSQARFACLQLTARLFRLDRGRVPTRSGDDEGQRLRIRVLKKGEGGIGCRQHMPLKVRQRSEGGDFHKLGGWASGRSRALRRLLDAEDWRSLVNAYLDEASNPVTGFGGYCADAYAVMLSRMRWFAHEHNIEKRRMSSLSSTHVRQVVWLKQRRCGPWTAIGPSSARRHC
jgi:hypothetical protein